MIIPEHIIFQLVQEAWPNGEIKIISINPCVNHSWDYYQVDYLIRNADGDFVQSSVSYSYSLHILPRMELWRQERINTLIK